MIALFWYGWEIALTAGDTKKSAGTVQHVFRLFLQNANPVAGALLMIKGCRMARCWIAMKTGKWPERIADVKETEDLLIDGDTN